MKPKLTKQKFNNYKEMSESAKNWDHLCTYQLLPHALEGEHHVIELPSIQLSYSERSGGFMHDAMSPKGAISIAVVQECKDKACFDRMKLHKGDILFFDDSKAFNFMSNEHIKVAIVSIPRVLKSIHSLQLPSALGHFIIDTDMHLSHFLSDLLNETIQQKTATDYNEVENTILSLLSDLLKSQTLQKPKLKEGEKIALSIRDQVYKHMDGKINITSLSIQHQVSQQTLQNSFKSLFGFTPQRFLRLLKLNLVHHNLREASISEYSVSKIALKWGFMHMGRFSKYYTELFGENPSLTLKTYYSKENSMTSECTIRQEEIN
jgi:AraC-like DNA-binding protein